MVRKAKRTKSPKKSATKSATSDVRDVELRDSATANRKGAIVRAFFVAGVAIVFALTVLSTIRQKSPTFDEPVHLLAGYSYLKWGDYRVNPEHPPWAKLLAALPLLAFDIQDPRAANTDWDQIVKGPPGIPAIRVAQEMFFVRNDAETLLFYGKIPLLILSLILGLFVFLWGLKWFGFGAAVASLVLFATDPNIIAHSSVIHTDVAFTTLFFIGTYFFQRTLFSRRWFDWPLTCVLFGMAAVTKFSSIAIVISWGLVGLLWIFRSDSRLDPAVSVSRNRKIIRLSSIFLSMMLTAYIFTWAVYGFRFHAIPSGNAPLAVAHLIPDDSSSLLQGVVSFASRFHLLPEAWIYGELYNFTYLKRTAFLLGELSDDGFWLYFPIAFFTKTPVPTLVLVFLAAVGFLIHRDQNKKKERFVLWIPVLVYFSIAVLSRMNIGVRHLLPIYPFLFVSAGESAAKLWASRIAWKRACLVLMGAWALWGPIATYPNYLAFFNELAGGPKSGHKILLDSNLDWGQDLKGLKSWMEKQAVKKILFLHFGTAEPAYYGIDAVPIPGSVLPPRVSTLPSAELPYTLAVSANHYYGKTLYTTASEKAFLKALRLKEPVATIGHSIVVFKLDPFDPQINYVLGTIMALRHEFASAEALFRKVVGIVPASAPAHEALAQVLARQNKLTEADHHYNQALALYKSSPQGTGSR